MVAHYPRRAKKKTNYRNIVKRYDKFSFVSPATASKTKVITINAANGRAKAAPPIANWPFLGVHHQVQYSDDIKHDLLWGVRSSDEIFLPFAWLNVKGPAVWQGLEQDVDGVSGDAEVQGHFDAISRDMRSLLAGHRITECVGEAAAAICVLNDFKGFKMIWGYHLHSGTGIDQIWEKDNGNGTSDFLIVEAKGPGAGLNFSFFVPPGFAQMEEGWVANHLYSMDRNSHAAGQRIVNALGLAFANLHPNYGGASKSYFGLSNGSKHKQAASRVFGIVATASWLSDGRLWFTRSQPVQYFT
ncbi:MAG: hypothetical protein KDH15_16475 [Rhodocyclaceae bacterium]|nr:hypothetical protein [Rhodocyclaceae bacterium]